MSPTELFISAACAFLGFFIVYTMMGTKKAAAAKTKAPDPPQANRYSEEQDADTRRRREGRQHSNGQQERAKQGPADEQVSSASWCAVLGVAGDASVDQVRSAYRTLIRKYHPDKVANLGPEFMTIADAKTREINAAYAEYNKLNIK